MTRMLAIGTVIGFTLTIIIVSVWERRSTPEPPGADAGAPKLMVNPKLLDGFRVDGPRVDRIGGPALDGKRIFSPMPTSEAVDDAGMP